MKKIFLILFSTAVLAGCAARSYDTSIYNHKERLSETLTKDNDGWYLYADGSRYKGTLNGAQPDGAGQLRSPDGTVYTGTFVNGEITGTVSIKYPNGDAYRGGYADGAPHGEGEYRHVSGETRKGVFDQGRLVAGEWQKLGQTRKGSFTEGELNDPSGVLVDVDGNTYLGRFVDGRRDGLVQMIPASGADQWQLWSEGMLEHSFPGPQSLAAASGKSESCNPRGEQDFLLLKGECANGLPQGQATLFSEDGELLIRGEFRDGVQVSGSRFTTEGELYTGEWQAGLPHGAVTVYRQSRLVYEGGFRQGKRHGQGICILSSGPEECRYHEGRRVDTAFLKKSFNQDLAKLKESNRKNIETIKRDTRDTRAQFEYDFKSRIRGLEKDLERKQSFRGAQAMLNTTSALMSGASDAQARAIAQQHAEEMNRLRAQIEREKAEYARELERRERRWLEEQTQRIKQAQADYDRDFQTLVSRHREECNTLPGREWSEGEKLCR